MKKAILALIILASSIVGSSYALDYVVYEDDRDYVVYDEPDYVVYNEPDYYIEEPVYYRPVRRTIIRQPSRVYVDYGPSSVSSFFSGLFGFGLGAAFGSALAD